MRSKSAFTAIVASAVVAFSAPVLAAAVDLSGEVNANLSTYTNGSVYPANGGPITIGGFGFSLDSFSGGGTGVIQSSSGSTVPFVIPVGQFGVILGFIGVGFMAYRQKSNKLECRVA